MLCTKEDMQATRGADGADGASWRRAVVWDMLANVMTHAADGQPRDASHAEQGGDDREEGVNEDGSGSVHVVVVANGFVVCDETAKAMAASCKLHQVWRCAV